MEYHSALKMREILTHDTTWMNLEDINVDPLLGGLHFLAVVNNAAVDMVYKHPFSSLLSVLLGTRPGVELLDHVVVLGLNF